MWRFVLRCLGAIWAGAPAWALCLPTPLPYADPFDSAALDSCWIWTREVPTRWSLAERPGWLRITPYGTVHGADPENAANLLHRTTADADFILEARVDHLPAPARARADDL